MNDVEPKDEQLMSELDTTVPNPANEGKPSDGWQMPDPVYQQTSGYLPQGYIEQIGLGAEAVDPVTSGVVAASPVQEPQAMPAVEIEPQPDLSEQLAVEPVVAVSAPTPKKRSSAARVIMILMGLAAMILFIAIFLAVIYFLFLAPPEGGSQF